MITFNDAKKKIDEIRNRESNMSVAAIRFLDWLMPHVSFAVLMPTKTEDMYNPEAQENEYLCTKCGEALVGEDEDKIHFECPYCNADLPFEFDDIRAIFNPDSSEENINAIIDEILWYNEVLSPDHEEKNEKRHIDMELGNFLFGHSRGMFPIERFPAQDYFADFFDACKIDTYGNPYKTSKLYPYCDAKGQTDTEIFTLYPYYWGDDNVLCALPNFVYKPENIVIRWYKYPLRDSYSNKELNPEKIKEILSKCRQWVEELPDE